MLQALLPLASSFLGGAGGGVASTPDSLESSLSQKVSPVFANSFAVGRGATATSAPEVGGDGNSSSPMRPEVIWIAGALGFGLVLVLALKK
jgi:hypothetical protein